MDNDNDLPTQLLNHLTRSGKELFMEKKKRVVINTDWCKGCGICVAFCPKEVLVLDDRGKARWAHQENCIRCGLCELRCPDLAIELEEMES